MTPPGFAVASFGDGQVVTEVPNLLIASTMLNKKPAGSSPTMLKKPAGSSPKIKKRHAKKPSVAAGLRCHLEYYKKDNRFCIRSSEPPKSNLLTIKAKSWSKEELRTVALQAKQKLQEEGLSLDQVGGWLEKTLLKVE